jgi:hypothetical protein
MTAVGWNNDGSQASETWEYTSWFLVSYLAQSASIAFQSTRGVGGKKNYRRPACTSGDPLFSSDNSLNKTQSSSNGFPSWQKSTACMDSK